LGLDIHFLPNLEVGSQEAVFVSGFLVSRLCVADVGLEVVMEFTEVDGELPSAIRGNVAFRMYGEVGVVTFVGEEGGDASGVARSVIVGKLGEWKK
jgi:hypothetical protein